MNNWYVVFQFSFSFTRKRLFSKRKFQIKEISACKIKSTSDFFPLAEAKAQIIQAMSDLAGVKKLDEVSVVIISFTLLPEQAWKLIEQEEQEEAIALSKTDIKIRKQHLSLIKS